MKKKLSAVIIFIIILVIPLISWPIVSRIDQTSINENRQKAAFPQFGKNFLRQFDSFFTDNAPYRDRLIRSFHNFDQKLDSMYEKILIALNLPYYKEINNTIIGKENWLFFSGDNSVGYYQGTNLPSREDLQKYVERAEKVNDYFKSQGKEFVIFIAPNKEQIYSEYYPNAFNVINQMKCLDTIVKYFEQNSTVKIIYPKAELINAKQNSQVYYKQDTHWNQLGGYIGSMSLLDGLRVSKGDVVVTQTTRVGGDLANMSLLTPIVDVDYDVIYRPEISLEIDSKVNLGYLSSNSNNKNLLLFGDSFRVAMSTVLSKEFETSIFNHFDTFTPEDIHQKEFDDANVVVFEAVERYESQIFSVFGILQRFIDYYQL